MSDSPRPSRSNPAPRRRSGRFRRLCQLWLTGGVAAVVVTAASALGWLEPIQVRTLDLLQRLGGQRFPPEVVIVAIDEAAFEKLGARQPISRAYLASVLRGLDRSGAAVIGLDITLSAPTTPSEDGALARAIQELAGVAGPRRKRLVLVDARAPESGPFGERALVGATARGSDQMPIDDDGTIRRFAPIVPTAGGASRPAFALAVLARLADAGAGSEAAPASSELPDDLSRYPYWRAGGWAPAGGPPTALALDGLWRINFVGPGGTFLAIPSDAV